MGHYLATENPEAAAEIDTRPEPKLAVKDAPTIKILENPPVQDLPDIGTIVVYLCRPGEGRAGKTEFPAMVMHHEPYGALYLLVFYDYDDQVCRPNIREASEDTPWPAWRHVILPAGEAFEPSRLNILRKDVDALRTDLDRTCEGIYAGYQAPEGGLMAFLVKFEEKLKDISKRLKAIEKKSV